MGFLLGGPYFHLRGRTGNNVGRVVKGKNVFSMRPTPSEKPPTPLQMDQRLKFGLFASWLSWVKPVLDIGFAKFDAKMSPYNAAVSYNMLHAITGVSPNFLINYPKVFFSRGRQEMLINPMIVTDAGAVINVSWDSQLSYEYSQPTDMVSLIVYNVNEDRFVVQKNAAIRSAGEYEWQLPIIWESHVVHVWAMVVGENAVSNTNYIGSVSIVG